MEIAAGYALGDAIALTGAVRDLHLTYPDLEIRVGGPFVELYDGVPYVSRINKRIQDDIRPKHPFQQHIVECHRQGIEQLHPKLPITRGADVGHVQGPFDFRPVGTKDSPYWVVVAGGKYGYETKWWPYWKELTLRLQQSGKTVVHLGGEGDWHPSLPGTIDLVGKTTIREMASVLYHCSGLICPITSAMHMLRAVGNTAPMFILAGGREPPLVTAYANQYFFHHYDLIPCSGCWANQCPQLKVSMDGKPGRADFAPCMRAITAEVVFQEINNSVRAIN